MVKKVDTMSPMKISIGSIFAAYYGFGFEAYPKASRERLEELVGPEHLRDSERLIEEVVSELGQLRPDWSTQSLESVGDWVKVQMLATRPTLDGLSLDTLAWVFTWSNR